MFFGEHVYKIDEKGRVPLPPKFRRDMRDSVVLTKGQDKCITLYPVAEWKRVADAQVAIHLRLGRRDDGVEHGGVDLVTPGGVLGELHQVPLFQEAGSDVALADVGAHAGLHGRLSGASGAPDEWDD